MSDALRSTALMMAAVSLIVISVSAAVWMVLRVLMGAWMQWRCYRFTARLNRLLLRGDRDGVRGLLHETQRKLEDLQREQERRARELAAHLRRQEP